jgi:hypothetical protein
VDMDKNFSYIILVAPPGAPLYASFIR